ncbi:MAG: GspE/PulE/PilB domain-containing protein [Planctomycetota bacterium]|jgi:hypothetical protein
MSRRLRRQRAAEDGLASVAGGAVTSDRLLHAARLKGRDATPLIQSLVGRSLPSAADLARAFVPRGGMTRLEPELVIPCRRAAQLIGEELLRRERCVPLDLLGDICILAVEAGRAETAVRAVRGAIQRDVLPVIAKASDLDQALEQLPAAPLALSLGPLRRKDSRVHERFRTLVMEREALDAISLGEERGGTR